MKRRVDRLYIFSLDDVQEAMIDLLKKRNISMPSMEAKVDFHLAGDEAGIEGENAAFMRWTENTP